MAEPVADPVVVTMTGSVLAAPISSAPFWFWWLLPVLVTASTIGVVLLVRHERRPKDGYDAVEDYARFRSAMAQVRDDATSGQDHP